MTKKVMDVELVIRVPKLEFDPPPLPDVDPVLLVQVHKMVQSFSVAASKVGEVLAKAAREMERMNIEAEWFALDTDALSEVGKVIDDIKARYPDEPITDRQRAQERSRLDRQRKSRKGRYKWGGSADE